MAEVEIIMVQRDLRMNPAHFAQRVSDGLAVEQIQIEDGGKYENLDRAAFGLSLDPFSQGVDSGQNYAGLKAKNFSTRLGYLADLIACIAPDRVPAVQISGEDERRIQWSFPPIRPCFVIEASTSTIARTATRAVVSEIS